MFNNIFKFQAGSFSLSFTPKNLLEIEKFSSQFAYGHREILLRYMELPSTTLLQGVLQHGVSTGPDLLRNSHMPRIGLQRRAPFWVYSKNSEKYLREHGVTNVHAIGSPWAYLCGMNEDHPPKLSEVTQEKYLVFPTHHSLSVDVPTNPSQIREKISYWKELTSGHELTICLLWTEYLDPIWRQVCEEDGITLTFAGVSVTNPVWSPHTSRVGFLSVIMRLLSNHTHCIFESPTSAIYYALSMGLNVGFFLETQTPNWESISEIHKEELIWLQNTMPSMVGQFTGASQLETHWREILGFDSVLSPSDLKQTLKFSSIAVPS